MARSMWLSMIVLAAAASYSRAGRIMVITDPVDDYALIRAVSGQKPVKDFAAEVRGWEKKLLKNDKEKIEKLLGEPEDLPQKDYAIPVGHPRMFLISGLRPKDEENKEHIAFDPVGDFAGIGIKYGVDGKSPQFAVLYFKVDKAFPKLKEMPQKPADKQGDAKKKPVVIRKHTIDLDHWEKLKEGMNKDQIIELFSAPAGESAPGTEYLTNSWGGRPPPDGKVHETLEWSSEKARIVVNFDDKGNYLTSEIFFPGRDPVTNITERLKWDREKFAKMKKYIEERQAAK